MQVSENMSLPLLLFLLLSSSSLSLAFDITHILGQHPELSTFSNYLTQTQLSDDINGRQTITVLAVANSDTGPLSGRPMDQLKKILSLHVLLDYYDLNKLRIISGKTLTITTLLQASGQALSTNNQGFINVTVSSGDSVSFSSAATGVPAETSAKLVKSVESDPFSISVLQISAPIIPSGIGGGSSSPEESPAESPQQADPVSPSRSPASIESPHSESPAPSSLHSEEEESPENAPVPSSPSGAHNNTPSQAPEKPPPEAPEMPPSEAPEKSPSKVPEPSSSVAPERSPSEAPEQSSSTAPEPSSPSAPERSTSEAPEPSSSSAAPERSSSAAPEKSPSGAPSERSPSGAPERSSSAAPEKSPSGAAPERSSSATPEKSPVNAHEPETPAPSHNTPGPSLTHAPEPFGLHGLEPSENETPAPTPNAKSPAADSPSKESPDEHSPSSGSPDGFDDDLSPSLAPGDADSPSGEDEGKKKNKASSGMSDPHRGWIGAIIVIVILGRLF